MPKQTIVEKTQPNTIEELVGILHPIVKKWFFSRFESFSLPQKFGVYEIHTRNNVLISAPTGATKTLTAFLSILNQIVDDALTNRLEDKTYAIYISPLKALNNDIQFNLEEPLKEIELIAQKELNIKELGIRVGLRTGDTTPYQRQKMIKVPPHILITTPESLGLICANQNFLNNLSQLQWVIIDEIHAIANNKRGVQLSLLLELLTNQTQEFTRIGLSATAEPLEQIAQYLVGTNRKCKLIRLRYLKDIDLQLELPLPQIERAEFEDIHDKTYERIHNLIQEHKSTLIFTNTRASTERIVHLLKTRWPEQYYEINEEPPFEKSQLIGAHHGSLSKEHRFEIESKLRAGKLKCVVCSTSLELGIDIGFIDLVVLLHSPKSVARLLQRIGRSGHKLKGKAKGRMFVTSRDQLVESAVLLHQAKEKHIDAIHIPQNALDVLSQFIVGCCVIQEWNTKQLYETITQSYIYQSLEYSQFMDCVRYLSDSYDRLEKQFVYPKLSVHKTEDKEIISLQSKTVKRIYLQNIGTITDSGLIQVKIGQKVIGTVDEGFVESLKPYDIFVLGGDTYKFLYSRGMTIQVSEAGGRKPTVPRWYSQSLSLPYDMAKDVWAFRHNPQYKHISTAKSAISQYFAEQAEYLTIPKKNELLVEQYADGEEKYTILHSVIGRKANECLAILLSHVIRRALKLHTDILFSDTGLYLKSKKFIDINRVKQIINDELAKKYDLEQMLDAAIEDTQHLKRRFRGVCVRGMLIIPNYGGQTKHVGKQQVKSHMLFGTLKSIYPNHPLLVETKREVLEDELDSKNMLIFLTQLLESKITITQKEVPIPSPFAHSLIVASLQDVLKAADRQRYSRNLLAMVLAQIALRAKKKGQKFDHKPIDIDADFSYEKIWGESKKKTEPNPQDLSKTDSLIKDAKYICRRLGLESNISQQIEWLIEGREDGFSVSFLAWLKQLLSGTIPPIWPDEIVAIFKEHAKELRLI